MLASIKDFWGHPFREDMTLVEWLAFIGFLLVAVAVWKIVLAHILDTL